MEFAAMLLMLLGTQWFVLFNVIAGAMAIPTDLKEASQVFRFGSWHRWRSLILRSEEHTSELQSQSNIVCRLLLEKKITSRHLSQARAGRDDISAGCSTEPKRSRCASML